jgi:hypothetical protein
MILPRTVDIVDIADIVTDFTLLPLIRALTGLAGVLIRGPVGSRSTVGSHSTKRVMQNPP